MTAADRLGAFVHLAPQPEGRGALAGTTIAVKDNIDVAGMPTAAGMEPYRGRFAERDAPCVRRLREAGAAILGKTLMDEAAFGALGDNPWFGRCHNPARHGFTPGGSSAGSAAAVAARLCEAALGTDTLGSVRIPASYCGVVGYLPGRGVIDSAGVVPLMPRFDRVGVLARTVATAAHVASVLAGKSLAPKTVGTATVGIVRGLEQFVAAPVLAATHAAAKRLARHRLVEVEGIDWRTLRRAALLLVEREGARIHAGLLQDPQSRISAALRAGLHFGRAATADRLERAEARIGEAARWLEDALGRCDTLLLPTTPQTAFAFGTRVPETQADLTTPASVAGLPAISVPISAWEGLPIGVQLVARDEERLLGLAAELG